MSILDRVTQVDECKRERECSTIVKYLSKYFERNFKMFQKYFLCLKFVGEQRKSNEVLEMRNRDLIRELCDLVLQYRSKINKWSLSYGKCLFFLGGQSFYKW